MQGIRRKKNNPKQKQRGEHPRRQNDPIPKQRGNIGGQKKERSPPVDQREGRLIIFKIKKCVREKGKEPHYSLFKRKGNTKSKEKKKGGKRKEEEKKKHRGPHSRRRTE